MIRPQTGVSPPAGGSEELQPAAAPTSFILLYIIYMISINQHTDLNVNNYNIYYIYNIYIIYYL